MHKLKDISNRKLFPGQSGRVGGFKELPDAGFPLYKVTDPAQAKYISNLRTRRKEVEEQSKKGIETLDKKLLKVDRYEKRRFYSGDRMGVLAQIDLIDDQDREKLKGQLEKEHKIGERDQKKRVHKVRKREKRTQRLESLLNSQDVDEEEKDEEEIERFESQKKLFAEIFKGDDVVHQPIILKAPSSGALETVLKEVNKTIMGNEKLSIIDAGVGPISESDVTVAEQAGAFIFSFDVPVSDIIEKRCMYTGVLSRSYKLIFQMTEDISKLVTDINTIGNEGDGFEEAATATIQQVSHQQHY